MKINKKGRESLVGGGEERVDGCCGGGVEIDGGDGGIEI